MEEMIKYLLIALFVGGAIPIFISFFTRKHPNKKNINSTDQR
jgi:hypothetical protein